MILMMREAKSPKVQKLILRKGEIFKWRFNFVPPKNKRNFSFGSRNFIRVSISVCVCVCFASSGDKYVVQLGYPPSFSGFEIKFCFLGEVEVFFVFLPERDNDAIG